MLLLLYKFSVQIYNVLYRLQDAEKRVLNAGGYVLRLGGLYSESVGPHMIYLKNLNRTEKIPRKLLHMIHYDDAASMIISIFNQGLIPNGVPMHLNDRTIPGSSMCFRATQYPYLPIMDPPTQRIFLGIDETPVTNYDLCHYVMKSRHYQSLCSTNNTDNSDNTATQDHIKILNQIFHSSSSFDTNLEKKYDNSLTRNILFSHLRNSNSPDQFKFKYPSVKEFFLG